MTRRARWIRPFAALFALWFAVVVGDPGLLHSCPMHGGHGAAHATAAASDAHAMSAMHGEHAVVSDHASHDAQHHGKTGPCTCVGQCCTVAPVATVPTVAAMHVPATVALAQPPLRVAFQPVAAAPDTRLPFANGPPIA